MSTIGNEIGYEALSAVLGEALEMGGHESVLADAYEQSAGGKGKERHANDKPWLEQPIFTIPDLVGSNAFAIGQAMKKLHEQLGMEQWSRGRAECLGAIVYLAAAAVRMQMETNDAAPGWDARRFSEVQNLTKDPSISPIIETLTAVDRGDYDLEDRHALVVDAMRLVSEYVGRKDADQRTAE